jgi:hypothetical protein
MAQLIQVRGAQRSRYTVNDLPVTSWTTQTFDLDDPVTRRELGRHIAIGQAFVVGDRAPANTAVTVVNSINDLIVTFTGGKQNPGTVDVKAGTLLLAAGTTQAVAAVSALALGAAHATQPRIDIVQVNETNGVVSVKAGTQRPTGPAAPAADASNVALYEVTRPPANSSRPVTLRDVRPLNP